MNSLIANSGIHFKMTEMEINPEEPMVLSTGRTLKYTFLETTDFLNGGKKKLDVCASKDGFCIPISGLNPEFFEKNPNGTTKLDAVGIPELSNAVAPGVVESYQTGHTDLIGINSLSSYRVKDIDNPLEITAAFDLLLNKWLPMPMYELDKSGISVGHPMGWCRVKIDELKNNQSRNGKRRFRLTWAFDTKLALDKKEALYSPYFQEGSGDNKRYTLCNRVDTIFKFMSISGRGNETAVSDYIRSLLKLDLDKIDRHRYKYISFYIYLINYLRLSGAAPEIILYNKKDDLSPVDIPVDMSIDIGNSQTCAVLFEKGDFRKARLLHLRNMSNPWKTYNTSFDMRFVFRKAYFGNDLLMKPDLFNWQSIVRVGEEANELIYNSIGDDGKAKKATNYSSPKRYLWDKKKHEARWDFLVKDDDPTSLKIKPTIFVENFTEYFDDDGSFLEQPKEFSLLDVGKDKDCHYSRSSLMTFVMVEILQQAIMDINSVEFRKEHGDYDCRRYLRNVIVTCPTAMPNVEQITLRQSVIDAYRLLQKNNSILPDIVVTPSPDSLKITDDISWENRGWSYDEAFASQLVYLYAEISERYDGENDKVIEMKGHVRPEHLKEGYERKSLTIGSIDIGAGTTDIMICSYQYFGKGQSRLVPSPLFWDSFYLAGDDILKAIIQNQIIEGAMRNDANLGCIYSALEHRMLNLSDDELKNLPIVQNNPNNPDYYKDKVDGILRAASLEERNRLIKEMSSSMLHDYFGVDSAMMGHKDRKCRNDFNTQISVFIAQMFLRLLADKYPAKLYRYDEIFKKEKPSTYLLEHFANHFGFRFEELNWRFEPLEVAELVRTALEPLMKQLSVVLKAYDCDIVVLSGRPCSLDSITELFIKYYPISPDRLVRLGQYRVGNWYPLADGRGYFIDQKSVVAVGAMVGYMANNIGFEGMELDFKKVVKNMKSTAKYIGPYKSKSQKIEEIYLSPDKNTYSIKGERFPVFLGCKQFNVPNYSARPLYALYNCSSSKGLTVLLQRNYVQNREELEVVDVIDSEGNTLVITDVELVQQSLVDDGKYWLDKGEFELSV